MQVNLGEKIKELRKRDGRKQEDLANALGVTPQAISRWEANGGYPDMGMIPSLANYFHITIDELFGYNNDRDRKIQEYNDKAQVMLNNAQDMTECIALLRKGLEEFPAEVDFKIRLAAALNKQGWNHIGENPNKFWEEAALLYEELLEHNQSSIIPLLSIYAELGEYEKAEKKACEQPEVELSREVLLGRLYEAEKGELYRGEAVLSLLHELRFAIDVAIVRNDELVNSKEGIELSLLVRHLFEKILGEECYGFHSDFCFLDLSCAKIAGNIKDYEAALRYFDSAFEQYTKFKQWGDRKYKQWEEKKYQKDNDCFETSILRAVNPSQGRVYVCEAVFFEHAIHSFPEEIKKQIRNNPKYLSIFTD